MITILNMCFYTYYDNENKINKDLYLLLNYYIEFTVNLILLLDSVLKIIALGFI